MNDLNIKDTLALDTLPGIRKIVLLERTASTQEVARELALQGEMEGTLVLALTQDSGKGRLGRVWESAPGGIYMTLMLQPRIGLKFLNELSVLAGRVTADTLKQLYGLNTRVKLPNDVYAFHPKKKRYLKLAGILTESASINKTPNWILLGMGVNLNNPVTVETGASVSGILKKDVSREEFLRAFFENFWRIYSAWEYSSESKS
ncbi:MAG: biotin--[acetyl-CoA-carboxylase] ligase [Elusimicrobia bacterium GWA2_56_46]|jgi:BirA family biotin operon repressor/biotin-[acetyl-CoA-carboxylase] ligase|nr:MAG: biotin--[acetyl-CoA-carboxylase] ligase [Elusimicrobia bacterium GWA2_56_46]OGR54873.1 MAG: biotin--[acetyl-CoA-carboxylase] ligase [Elusimicrobia bacterium GWC2_56_31]HBB66128.1 biotin--[acetyl-CoA-carboxylase] ligase [Elusimicrobiota bacterium]HBW23333.1 biotin--[acetyl-CoA-carboxylase] ligase [Elusimicrobiota bacterium]